MSAHEERADGDPVDAAGWRVALDAAPDDAALAERFGAWLDASPAHERAMERVELAIELARHLATDPEITAAAARPPRRRWITLGLAAAAAIAVAVATAVAIAPWAARLVRLPIVQPELRAAAMAGLPAPANSVVVLPTGVVVDGGSVALLPFASGADADTLAMGLEADVAAALRGVPGLYVVSGVATAPYATALDLSAAEVGSQLGARGLVDARIQRTGARVHITAELRDARSGTVVWQSDLDEPVDRLAHVRDVIADGVALTLLGSSAQAATPLRADAPAFAANIPGPALLDP
jgi:TolB-like protein